MRFIRGDVRNDELVRDLLADAPLDLVFHLAAQPLVPASRERPFETVDINVMGTCAVLESIRIVSPKTGLILASSAAYYGTTHSEEMILEDRSPLPAESIYAPSKVAADVLVRSYVRTYGMSAATCRFMNTYGPGDTNFSRLVPHAIRNLIEALPYDFGERDDGTTRLDFLHIDDMTSAYIRMAEQLENTVGEAFNFGTGAPVCVAELVQRVGQLFGSGEVAPIFSGPRRDKPIIKSLDTSKARRILDWQPSVPLVAGLSETIGWYRDQWKQLSPSSSH